MDTLAAFVEESGKIRRDFLKEAARRKLRPGSPEYERFMSEAPPEVSLKTILIDIPKALAACRSSTE